MNSGPLVFLGLFVTMAVSWLGFVMAPELQLGDLQSTTNIVINASGVVYPTATPGTAHQGAEIYRAQGCAACHTEQVRPKELGSDTMRGWGVRRSTAYDYLYDQPVQLGSLRVGPDLANVSQRVNTASVLLRLYEPRAVTRGSIMPPYPYLFDTHKIAGVPSPDALPLTGPYAPPEGYEVVPRPEALELAAYVMSLHQKDYLFEAPPPFVPKPKTNAPPATATGTNAPATNSPATK